MFANYDTITEFRHKCIIIKIKQETVYERGSIYEAVRHCWRNSKKRAEQAECVLAVIDRVVEGVFEPRAWYCLNDEECKKIKIPSCKKDCRRILFVGKEAENDIKNMYLDKYIPCKYRKQGMAAPVLYTYQ